MTMKVTIKGTGSYLPTRVLTNQDLEKMVDTTNEWILERTGISERRIADADTATSDLAKNAGTAALDQAGLKPEELDLIIVATITPDQLFPSTACFVQEKIGAKNAVCFDIGAACSGYIYGIMVADSFLRSGTFRNALVIGAEKLSAFTDWTDRSTCVLFGDGAGAVVLSASDSNDTILGCYLGSDGSAADLLRLPAGGSRMPSSRETVDQRLHFLKMEGRDVFRRAVQAMCVSAESILKKCGKTPDEIALMISHQANKRIINAVSRKLSLPEKKVFINVDRCGNTQCCMHKGPAGSSG